MKKKLSAMLTLLLAATMAFTGCGSSQAASSSEVSTSIEQTLRMNLGADPKTLDPQLNAAVDGGHIINNTFEGLMREEDGDIVNALAEAYTVSEDGLVYTFTLRDALWSDGEPVTAGDFEFAWKRGANPMTASEYIDIFTSANILNAAEIARGNQSVDELGVVALDEKTLQVTLAQPTDYFLQLTTFATFMPVREDVVDNDGLWAKDPAKAIGNGPFKLTSYKMGDQLVLEKNENYWNAEAVTLEKIIGYMIVDASTAHTKYLAGDLDVNELVPTSEIPKLIAEDPTFYVLPKIGTYYYAYNMNNPALQDAKVRQALSLAIDRQKLVDEVTKGGQIPATGFMPQGIKDTEGNDFSKTAGDYGISVTGDIEKAKALLAEAGYASGAELGEIEILYNTMDSHKAIAESVQEMLKQGLGVNVKLTNQEWAVFQDTTKNNAFEALARRGWNGDYSDPQTMLEIFESTNAQNIGRYASEAFDTEMAQSRETVGAERMTHLYNAHNILMEDLPIIPLYYYVTNVMVQDEVEGWELTTLGKFWFGDVEIVEFEE